MAGFDPGFIAQNQFVVLVSAAGRAGRCPDVLARQVVEFARRGLHLTPKRVATRAFVIKAVGGAIFGAGLFLRMLIMGIGLTVVAVFGRAGSAGRANI
ncbi:MAG: hypothetical protein ACOH2H_18530 [Cypionkella sp.]